MSDRIEKVSPSKPVTNDVGYYGQRSGYSDQANSQAFEQQFKQDNEKKEARKEFSETAASAPYVVNLGRATQSLFYKDDSTVKELLKDIHENR